MINPLEHLIPKPQKPRTSYSWGQIMAILPDGMPVLRVDGNPDPLNDFPPSLINPYSLGVGDRVYMVRDRRRLTIIGKSNMSAIPVGFIGVASTLVIPRGWLVCEGQSIPVEQEPQLFEYLGYSHGGSGGFFNVPDIRGRAIMGYDPSQTEFNSLGKLGGTKTHTLTPSEMPAHNHPGTAASAGAHTHTVAGTQRFLTTNRTTDPGKRAAPATTTGDHVPAFNSAQTVSTEANTTSTGAHTHTVTTNNTGGGGSHNNLSPYITLPYIIKT